MPPCYPTSACCSILPREPAAELWRSDAQTPYFQMWTLAGGGDEVVRLWDLATGRERVALKGHTNYVRSLAFSPDGTPKDAEVCAPVSQARKRCPGTPPTWSGHGPCLWVGG